MATGLTIGPTGSIVEANYVRPEPVPVRTAVATTLAPSQSVTAVADSSASMNRDAMRATLVEGQTRSDYLIDPQTREVIYRVIDEQSGRVVRQVPEEAALKLRAYVRAATKPDSSDHKVEATA